MSYVYPRNRKQIHTLNGFFDPFDNLALSDAMWRMSDGSGWTAQEIIAAPALSNKYALHFKETCPIGVYTWDTNNHSTSYAAEASVWHGLGKTFWLQSDLYFKNVLSFRMRIVSDYYDATSTDSIGSYCSGAFLDACSNGGTDSVLKAMVKFNVDAQKIVRCNGRWDNLIYYYTEDETSWDWAGSYDTWYDVRIEWSYDFFTAPNVISLSVYINNGFIGSEDIAIGNWRTGNSVYRAAPMGRCGVISHVQPQVGGSSPPVGTEIVEAYFTDVCFNDTKDILGKDWNYWKIAPSILKKGTDSYFEGGFVSRSKERLMVTKNSDVTFWRRKTTSDLWTPKFRGIIRSVDKSVPRIVKFEGGGYETGFYGDKTGDLSFSAKTAAEIITGAINTPVTKYGFNLTSFFDTVTNTYDRIYKERPVLEVLEEMSYLEGKIMFLDIAHAWHFEDYRANQGIGRHLIWGQSKIFSYQLEDLDSVFPSVIRVSGSGVYSERVIPQGSFGAQNRIIYNISRPELTTQTEVDEVSNFYASRYLEPIQVLNLDLIAIKDLQLAETVRVTIPELELDNHEFLVASFTEDKHRKMSLVLIEARPDAPYLLASLQEREETLESHSVAHDTEAATQLLRLDGIATMRVSCNYEILYDAVVQRSGPITLTNTFIDDLLDIYDRSTADPDEPTHVAYGTDDSEEEFAEIDLVSQSGARIAGTSSKTITYYYGIREVQISADFGSGVTGLKEVGVFSALTGTNLKGRGVVDPYTETGGTVTIRFKFRLFPEDTGSCRFTCCGTRDVGEWIYDGSTMSWRGGAIFQLYTIGIRTWHRPTLFQHSPHQDINYIGYEPYNDTDYYGTQLSFEQISEKGILKVTMAGTFVDIWPAARNFAGIGTHMAASGYYRDLCPFYLIWRDDGRTMAELDADNPEKDYNIWLRFKRGSVEWTDV